MCHFYAVLICVVLAFHPPIADIDALCKGMPPPRNTTCSWRGYEDDAAVRAARSVSDWFQGCACYMATHQSGP